MSSSDRVAATAICAAALMSLSLPLWLPVDEAAYRWIQSNRTCAIDQASRWIDTGVRIALGAVIVIGAIAGRERRPTLATLALLLAVFLAGSLGVELLKTAIERLRPSSTPAMVSGNSFPSGHTVSTTMGAVAALLLVRARRWSRPVEWGLASVAVTCVAAQAVARMLTGSHWLSDAITSLFLGVGWMMAADRMRALPRSVLAGTIGAAAVAFVFFDYAPWARLHVPSAIEEKRSPIANVEFESAEERVDLLGGWSEAVPEPIGPVAWAMSPEVGVVLVDESGGGGLLKVTMRPRRGPENRRECTRVVVTVNDWSAPEVALTRGWREYHFEPPPGAIGRGPNRITFRITADDMSVDDPADGADRGLVAFRYVRLYPR